MRKIIRFLGGVILGKHRRFASMGKQSSVPFSVKTGSPNHIFLGNHVSIGIRTWLDAVPLTGYKDCSLVFKDGVTIGEYNHIYATRSITFEENCLTANYVYISDNLHAYEDTNIPIKKQGIRQLKPVIIGKGCWIGEHVSIIGASVGANSVIGANSVVTRDIPDYCVAVGAPAYIIKRYDVISRCWKKTDKTGNFIED